MNVRNFMAIVVALVSVLVAAVPTLAAGSEALDNVRDATAAYSDPSAALAAGYELLTDAADIACIDEPGAGAMGIHYVKGALVQSGAIDPARPQALVYERQDSGGLHLVAVEYVAIQAAWDSTHSAPPTLFGQKFSTTPVDNRYGLPAFYSLHAWIGKDNPQGTFNMWNPSVSCADGAQADATTQADEMEMAH